MFACACTLRHTHTHTYPPQTLQHHAQVDIDDRQYDVDKKHGPSLFKTYWNESVKILHPDATIAEDLTRENLNQWQWAMAPLIQAARQSFSVAIREQFTVCIHSS